MRVLDICKKYFNGFQQVSDLRKNDNTTNVLAVLKILSYFTVIIPLGFAAAYGVASLSGRINKKRDLSSQDKSINDKAKTTLLKKDSSTPKDIPSTVEPANRQLAEKIIAARGEGDKYVKDICSGNFLVDPTAHLVRKMIERGVGMFLMDDGARSFVIGQIPGFIEKVSSPDYLRSFAEHYFENNRNKTKIMQIFEKSLSNEEFQRDLKSAVNQFNSVNREDSFYYADSSLRIPLTIYYQSAQLKGYSYPEDAHME
ncbi:hypothetical protein PHSC3_001554 [Chlamydiales bacterium STE3]|nr:hypothetical protein PHSC3_001554 [Chlamydiales bacterium STE3]